MRETLKKDTIVAWLSTIPEDRDQCKLSVAATLITVPVAVVCIVVVALVDVDSAALLNI